MQRKHAVVLCGLIGIAVGYAIADSRLPLTTVEHVDLNRYIGKWFEIARYPNQFEGKCSADVSAEYSIDRIGKIRVVNSCVTQSGKISQTSGTAKVVDPSTNAKLKVTFFWPFYGNYWILHLGPNYEFSVVGEPTRKYLWILSRSPSINDADYQSILHEIAKSGYDPARLVKTTQRTSAKR